jgi:Flp pilus assembly protein TadG
MQRKRKGQSLVEMALILPLLLFLIFAIVDMGWFIYGYGTIYNAARRGAEQGSLTPPQMDKLTQPNDPCTGIILKAVQDNAPMYPNITVGENTVISYPSAKRAVGEKIRVTVTYQVEPLTPLFTFASAFGFASVNDEGKPVMTISSTAQRSIESLGRNPNFKNGEACP